MQSLAAEGCRYYVPVVLDLLDAESARLVLL